MATSKTVKLTHPIANGTEQITELTFRKPRAKDFRRMPMNPTMGDILDMVGQLTGQPKHVVDDLEIEDLATVSAVIEGFIPAGLGTGIDR